MQVCFKVVLLSHNEPKEAFKADVAFLTKLDFLFLKERYLWIVTRIKIMHPVHQAHLLCKKNVDIFVLYIRDTLNSLVSLKIHV